MRKQGPQDHEPLYQLERNNLKKKGFYSIELMEIVHQHLYIENSNPSNYYKKISRSFYKF